MFAKDDVIGETIDRIEEFPGGFNIPFSTLDS